VIADLTAAEVDSDEIRHRFTEQLRTIELIMTRERVSGQLIRYDCLQIHYFSQLDDWMSLLCSKLLFWSNSNVMGHLRHAWAKSKGLQPRDIFGDLHPSLRSDVFRHFVGEELKKVRKLVYFCVLCVE